MIRKKTFIIAEIGPNHNGSLAMALKMISRLSKSGVDSVKFIKKNKSFISEKKTIPVVFKSKKLSIDIDNRKDYLLAKRKS